MVHAWDGLPNKNISFKYSLFELKPQNIEGLMVLISHFKYYSQLNRTVTKDALLEWEWDNVIARTSYYSGSIHERDLPSDMIFVLLKIYKS